MRIRSYLLILLSFSLVWPAWANDDDPFELSLEQLMGIEVISVSKRSQSKFTAAAAVHVVTAEDIERLGATSLGEALRGVPGLQVARLNNNIWAISGRGFNSIFANKLQVLVDGRSIYNDYTAGTFWENHDFVMADIERIEVIRGPGAAMWGANAVNGVINIITKDTAATLGTRLSSSLGEEQRMITMRHGTALSDDVTMRVYAKYSERDFFSLDGLDADDDAADTFNIGARFDAVLSDADTLSATVNYLNKETTGFFSAVDPITNQPLFPRFDGESDKYYAMVTWTHDSSSASQHEVKAYVDHLEDESLFRLGSEFDTVDVTYQHTWGWAAAQTLVWGAGFRQIDYSIDATPNRFITPGEDDYRNTSFFLHNETSFANGAVALSYGVRFEDNDRGSSDPQPNVRLSWQVADDKVLWASVARAARTPSISENGIFATGFAVPSAGLPPFPVPLVGAVQSFGDLDSELLDAVDVGFRWRVNERFTLDLAAFDYTYEDVILAEFQDVRCTNGSSVFADPFCVATSPVLTVFNTTANAGEADSTGAELTVNWMVNEQLDLSLHYSYLDLDMDGTDATANFFADQITGPNPPQQAALNLHWSPADKWSVDAQVRYADAMTDPSVDSYTTVDLRVAWKPRKGLHIAAVAHNLGSGGHIEHLDAFDGTLPVEIEPAVHLHIDFAI